MSETAKNQTEYFLGVDGEQKGPYSEAQVVEMLSQGEVNAQTPIWCSGMLDWQELGSLPVFQKTESNPKENVRAIRQVSSSLEESEDEPTASDISPKSSSPVSQVFKEPPAQESLEFETVFSGENPLGGAKEGQQNSKILIAGSLILVLGAGAYFWTQSQGDQAPVVAQVVPKENKLQARSLELSKLQVEFNQDPTKAIPKMLELIKLNPTDNVGLEALEVILSYYRQKQLFSDAADTLMVANRPQEALEYYLKDPPNYSGVEKAYEKAIGLAKPTEKKDLLLKHIEVLISRVGNIPKAITQIQTLEKEFPGTQHPYHYYLKSTDQQIADLFSRISFHFSESLNTFINGELNQVQFENKPLIQVTKDKAGKYRIVASYKGNVVLRNDRIPNVYFVFWFWNDQWSIVDTNITKERAKFAQEDQKKRVNEVLSATELLSSLENIFKTKFPGKGLHEMVTPPKRDAAATEE